MFVVFYLDFFADFVAIRQISWTIVGKADNANATAYIQAGASVSPNTCCNAGTNATSATSAKDTSKLTVINFVMPSRQMLLLLLRISNTYISCDIDNIRYAIVQAVA